MHLQLVEQRDQVLQLLKAERRKGAVSEIIQRVVKISDSSRLSTFVGLRTSLGEQGSEENEEFSERDPESSGVGSSFGGNDSAPSSPSSVIPSSITRLKERLRREQQTTQKRLRNELEIASTMVDHEDSFSLMSSKYEQYLEAPALEIHKTTLTSLDHDWKLNSDFEKPSFDHFLSSQTPTQYSQATDNLFLQAYYSQTQPLSQSVMPDYSQSVPHTPHHSQQFHTPRVVVKASNKKIKLENTQPRSASSTVKRKSGF